MDSLSRTRIGGIQQQMSGLAKVPPPPPSCLGAGSPLSPLSPRLREHAVQPPALTTSVGGSPFQGRGFSAGYSPAPNSTTSLSSPFSQRASPYSPSLGAASRGTSPMAMRQSAGFNVPYNPREWGSVQGGSPQTDARPLSQAQQGLAQTRPSQQDNDEPPPPPYSPPPASTVSRTGASTTLSSSNARSSRYTTMHHSTSVTSSTSHLPELWASTHRPRPRPLSMVHSGRIAGPSQSTLPPPPSRTSRSSSRQPAHGNAFSISVTAGRAQQNSELTPAKAVDDLHRETVEMSQQLSQAVPGAVTARPPASKRAVSANAVSTPGCSSGTSSQPDSTSSLRVGSWEPGMPLPGPPPGPPPSAFRSQSASGLSEQASRNMLMPAPRPRTRQAPQLGSSLDPVPPTPAGWIDEEQGGRASRHVAPLHINTTNLSSRVDTKLRLSLYASSSPLPSAEVRHSSSGLCQSTARHDTSTKGIRERRSESRHARDVTEPSSSLSICSNPWAEALEAVRQKDLDLVQDANGLNFQSMRTETVAKNAHRATPEEPHIITGQRIVESTSATPKPRAERLQLSLDLTQTPPFSAGVDSASPSISKGPSSMLPPKALPTPPLQRSRAPSSSSRLATSHSQERPVSHILLVPNEMSPVIPTPLSPRRLPLSAASQNSRNERRDSGNFIQRSLERHQAFLERERCAATDDDRLHMFADYILAESRLRRREYSQAWMSGNFDVRFGSQRLVEKNVHAPRRSSGLQDSTLASPTRPKSPISSSNVQIRPESTWQANYQPCLSPIASMSMNDEMSSRGRAPSRWWESNTGSNIGGKARKLERSKRESKYMGLPRDSWGQSESGNIDNRVSSGVMQAPEWGQYPSEKAEPERLGYYDEPHTSPFVASPAAQPTTPQTAEMGKCDISRLVTLPPPYPRHFPALNNNHPDLFSYRTIVRSVSDYAELKKRRQRYKVNAELLEKDSRHKLAESRRVFRSNIHAQIDEGSISYAEAAEAEEALVMEEQSEEIQRLQADFDSFQDVVLNPLRDTLNERVRQTTVYIDELHGKLLREAESRSPNQTQEEGDEQPELLEKLTQMKWLFEAREQLHREIFGLLSERNRKFKAVALLPYQQTNNRDKIRDTEAFFIKDEQDRQLSFESDSLARYRDFLEVIDENVARGVELQLCAFWDIAPNLVKLLQDIPEDLCDLDILIPPDEYVENPSYMEYPLQYLYSLLCHAERSTYQFIESQTNLLCLLHEAKSGVMAARCKLGEAERIRENDGCEEAMKVVMSSVSEQRSHDEHALTVELKDKVTMVEDQWREALGDSVQTMKERIKTWLIKEGGWEDMEQAED